MLMAMMLVSLLTGCWNRKELNDLGIQLGAAIDKIGDQYQVAVQVVVPGEVANRNNRVASPVTMFKASAPSLFAAFRKLTETSPRKIYGAHIRVLVLGESVAKEGIAGALDLLLRDHEIRSDFYAMIAKGVPAERVLKVMTSLEQIPANKLFHSLDTSAKAWAPTTTVTLDQLIEKMLTEGVNPVLTGIRVIGETQNGEKKSNVEEIDSEAKLLFTGLAVMEKDRLIGWLNEQESKGYNYITDQVTSTAGFVTCPSGELLTLETIHSHTEMKGKIENGEPVVEIKLVDESNIAEAACKIDLSNPETIRMIEAEQKRKKIELMENTVNVVKSKYKTDIFGFGQAIYRADPKAWSKLKANWVEHFVRMKIEYDVQVHIRKIGMTETPLKNELKE
jgi:spore germination protein KC